MAVTKLLPRLVWPGVLLVITILIVSTVKSCQGERDARSDLEHIRITNELKEKGFLVAVQLQQKELEARAKEIPILQAELERLEEANSKARVVRVAQVRTEPDRGEGEARPAPSPGEPCPDCLFAEGDLGELRIGSVDVQNKEGVTVAVMGGQCCRLEPGPETCFLQGVASATISELATKAPPRKPGWGAAFLGAWGTTGFAGSALGVSPPIVGDSGSVAFGVTGGPGLVLFEVGVFGRF